MHKHTTRFAAVVAFVIGLIAPAVWAQNTVQTIAGGGPNNLPALKSSLGSPAAVALDSAGNMYIGDLYSERVLKISAAGNVTVLAGTGAHGGPFGNGGPAIGANVEYPSGIAVDSSGNVFVADRSLCLIREVAARTGIISAVVGVLGNCSYSGDGGPAAGAALNNPSSLAIDKFGNLVIADTNNCLIREVSATTGVISTIAGTLPDVTGDLHCGYSGDGGPATSAKLGFPNDLAVDSQGNIIIADTTNCVVRSISVSTGFISTVAGNGTCGYSGDGGLATDAEFSQLFGVAVDASGNVFVADTPNCAIRKISSASSDISTLAGNNILGCGYSGDGGLAIGAQINQPYSVAVDSSGNVFIADYKNSAIREVATSTGNISTFAGVAVPNPFVMGQTLGLQTYSGDGFLATNAALGYLNDTPYGQGLATDASGNVYIADTYNSAIREVSASTGIITTIAGDGVPGFSGDGGPAASARIAFPRDVAVDHSGNIFIMDTDNCVVRKITASTGVISTVAGTPPDSAGDFFCDFSGDGGPATSAELYPFFLLSLAGGVAVDNSGNIFIADTGNGVIREVSAATGIINTVAGIPESVVVASGDGGPATSATLNSPYAVTVDNSGNILIADTWDYAIREVAAINGNMYTVAGNLALGQGYFGDGGPAGAAQLRNVFNLYVDPAGNLFLPDPNDCVIREVSGSTGLISTVAGTRNQNDYYCGYSGDGGPALSAVFDDPSSVGAGTSGDLVVMDNTRVRSVAGLVQGPAASAVPFPDPLVFPTAPLGFSSALPLLLSNRGSLPNSVSSVAISGPNASDFLETDKCAGHTLAASGGTCVINVTFTPSIVGPESAVIIAADAAGTQNVSVTGAGVQPPGFSLSVQTLPFGLQMKTVKSTPMGVTVTNNGSSTLTIGAVTISGANAADFAISGGTCSGAMVPVNAMCSVNLTFTPSTTGAETASLKFIDNAPGSPQSVGLTGTGTDFSIGLAPGGSATATVPPGSPATYNLEVAPISGFNGTVSLSCAGTPAESTCMPSEASATPNGNTAATFSIQVTTTAPSIATPDVGRQMRPFDGLRILPMVLMAALLSTLAAFASRFRGTSAQRRCVYTFAVPLGVLLLATILTSCGGGGGGSQAPPPPVGGTPAGNYTLTITGTSNGVSHSQTLTLTVN